MIAVYSQNRMTPTNSVNEMQRFFVMFKQMIHLVTLSYML